MNTKNNKQRRESVEKIEKAFMSLLQTRELKHITVSDICKETALNRSTFYANFEDVYALADAMRIKLEQEFSALFTEEETREHEGALKMFSHIRDNQLFYKTYFKLGYDKQVSVFQYDRARAEKDFQNAHIQYHIEFFRNGINAMIKMWLDSGCRETPQEMADILKAEYQGRQHQ